MKKLIFLFAIVISVLTFTSCEPEIVNPEKPKTESFNIYEYATTTDFSVDMDTTLNDTTYHIYDCYMDQYGIENIFINCITKNDTISKIYVKNDEPNSDLQIRISDNKQKISTYYTNDGILYKKEIKTFSTGITIAIRYDRITGVEISREQY
jgi:hypothetical protein